MALAPGSRLGPYEILSPLGAGGMGEVYKAKDTRLERTVAVKVLPAHLSGSAERRERFEREARTISQLSHPHICALYDVGRQGETDYLVMELLEGETLTARLAKGPLPSEQLLRYGVQIGEALDRAHRQGIVHRDLKPGNVMLTKSGVKLLDFGLAKFVAAPAGAQLSALPTEAGRELTDTGQILGTLQYMAPEQLEGKEADARTDIFGFGAVLYEMATGRRAFSGRTQASLISAILRDDPQPVSQLAPMSPPALDRVVKSCLAKDPEDRWQTAHDVMLQLQWIAEGGSRAGIPAPLTARRRGRERLLWGAVAILLVTASFFGTAYFRSRSAEAPSLHVSVLPPEGKMFGKEVRSAAISPDGRRILFGAQDAKTVRLYVRAFDSYDAQPLEGTDDALYPFWSPDSNWIGFFQNGKLKRIRVSGGPAEVIADAPNPRGGSWTSDGTILFAPFGGGAIRRVSEKGGPVTPVTFPTASENELSHRFPSALPDGRHFLFLAMKVSRSVKVSEQDLGIFVGSTDSRAISRLLPDKSNALYASPGFVLFRREQTLMALPFDDRTVKVTGAPIPVADKIEFSVRSDGVFSASSTGVLVYRTGPGLPLTRLSWLDRSGKAAGSPEVPAAVLGNVRLSADGRHAIVGILDMYTDDGDLWSYDLERGTRALLLSSFWGDEPVWSADGRRIALGSSPFATGSSSLYVRDASGEGKAELLSTLPGEAIPVDWSSDGRWILLRQVAIKEAPAKYELWVWSVAEKKELPYLQGEGRWSAGRGVFSPDTRWVAYQSTESGKPEVSVRPFPGPGERTQISRAGGVHPHWSRDGKEIVFQSPEGELMAVEVKTQGGFQAGEPRALLTLPADAEEWEITGDHQRILAQVPAAERKAAPPLSVVTNWATELKK